MKNLATKLLLISTVLMINAGHAIASECGGDGLPSCDVPEPGTAYLFLGALGVAALVAKFRKK